MPVLEANAAGIDVGAREMYVAILADGDVEPVRIFPTFTADLESLADWLVDQRDHHGGDGINRCLLDSAIRDPAGPGIRVCLVNARHMRNVPGRRTDWHECQWLQYLHSLGLPRAAFRPEQQVVAVRSLMRHRKSGLVETAGMHIRHVHKALTGR
jgi:hypothetical protein